MKTRLKELLYDINKTKDIQETHKLIAEYAFKHPLDDLDSIIEIQCNDGNWNWDKYMQGLANGLILARSCITGENPEFLEAPKDGFLADKEQIEKSSETYDEKFSNGHEVCDNPIVDARRVLRESFKDEGMKLGYMANMRMFINDRTDILIDEQVIYDMLDYIFKE